MESFCRRLCCLTFTENLHTICPVPIDILAYLRYYVDKFLSENEKSNCEVSCSINVCCPHWGSEL